MTKRLPKEGPNNTLPPPQEAVPVVRLNASELRLKAHEKEQAMQERIKNMTAGELSPDLGFYLDTVNDGGTIKARRLG